jgi:PAS domain S-box-containing protein
MINSPIAAGLAGAVRYRVGTWEATSDPVVVSLDSEAKRIFDVPSNLLNEPFADWCERTDPGGFFGIAREIEALMYQGAGGCHWSLPLQRENGDVRHVELTALCHGGSICGTVRDCTTQHEEELRALIQLRESETRFRLMANGLPHIVWVHDASGRQEFVNSTFCEFFGVSPEEMTGDRWRQLMHPEDQDGYLDEFVRCVRERRPFHAETRVLRADGEWRWIESFARPRQSGDGRFLGFVGTSVDISERKAAEADLQRARDEALLSANARERLLAIVAHELRAPINPIRLLADSYLSDSSLQSEIREDFGVISSNVAVLSRLAEDLTDLHSIERGTLSLRFQPIDVNETVKQALAGVRSEFRVKHVDVVTQLDPRTPLLMADPHRLEQVLWNLLRNAFKFTPSGGRVEICSEVGAEVVAVTVTDTGIGMTRLDLKLAFEAFSQGERVSRSREYGGLGLGLTIARMIVHGHGGTIRAASAGPGCGSSFTIELPVRRNCGSV